MEERQTNYTIGELVELPSKGLIYEKRVNPQIELRSMTARDEMKRCAPSSSNFKILADIIEGCMIEKPAVHVYDMCLADYEYLLHRLRIVSYGDEYKLALRCPWCSNTVETTAHLEELPVKVIDIEEFEATRTVMLPKSGKSVSLRFQTPKMLDEVESKTREAKRKFKGAEIDFNLLVTLELAIESVDGLKLSPANAEDFVTGLAVADMTCILNRIEKLNSLLGIENALTVICPDCGGEVATTFRYGQEFFRPSSL